MKKTQRNSLKIRDGANAEFLKWAEGCNLDLDAFPSQTEIIDADFRDDEFAPLENDKNGPNALKNWIRAAQKPGHADYADVRASLDEAVDSGQLPKRGDDESVDAKVYFVEGQRVRVQPRPDGLWECRHNGKLFIGQTRDGCAVAVAKGTLHEPDAESKLRISRGISAVFGASNQEEAQAIFIAAVKEYVAAAGGPSDENELASLRFLPLVNQAVAHCWREVRPDFAPTSDWQSFVEQYASGRPYTVALLDSARAAYESRLQAAQRTGATRQPATTESTPQTPAEMPEDFTDLSDAEVTTLLGDVRRQVARQRKPWVAPSE